MVLFNLCTIIKKTPFFLAFLVFFDDVLIIGTCGSEIKQFLHDAFTIKE